jgi:hypothetical protein
MLIRILADNPGASFTKNVDKQFADTVKHLLRNGRDPSVAQILRETLDSIHRDKAYDTNLNTLFAMWAKEKKLMADASKHVHGGGGGGGIRQAPRWPDPNLPQGFGSGHARGGLPPPVELAARIEEARTSAKLLLQLVQSTPANELLGNDLVKEFAERCTSAQRSVQTYINCDNPPPDDDTMLTLIETNEQLSLAASKHQRAVLQARRAVGASPSPPVPNHNYSALPPVPAPATAYNPPPLQQPAPLAEIPILPPLGLEPNEPKPNNPASYKTDELPLPPSLQAAPGRPRSNSNTAQETEDNPFADHHTYSGPPAGQAGESAPTNGYTPYRQGYQPTPSYLGRQESAANNVTMHGAGQSSLPEEEGYAAGNRAKTPEDAHQRHGSDVSPITDRGTVTYRY